MTIRRGSDNGNIKGPSEKIRSSSIEEITQKQNTIEIELNKNKINNTSYDKQSFNNAEESDSDDDDKEPPLIHRSNSKGIEIDSDDEEMYSDCNDMNKHESEKKNRDNN